MFWLPTCVTSILQLLLTPSPVVTHQASLASNPAVTIFIFLKTCLVTP